ncbi:trypsin-like peptidase domain-containing protein [Actinoplanes sp. NPDC051411]|uniref:trypsin-like peptidase domain-containing protein n=1 Tax=Actinoplanes sp. NPDC051411 TaxID=3155522 RepID=UPI0034122E72
MSHPGNPALDHVRRCTVQLTSKRLAGTGFFVAPNIVVTCAHVVDSRSGSVTVRWQGQPIKARVLERVPDSPGRKGETYRFPDLAFIGLKERIDHPTADLQSLLLRRGAHKGLDLVALAFNRDAPVPDAAPDPVQMHVQGPSDTWVKATPDSGVVPGMSGAPIVDRTSGRVCGILKYYSRGQNAIWFVDAEDIEKYLDHFRKVLGAHAPSPVNLFRPEPGDPLHNILTAQRTAAEKLPYQVVKGHVPLSTVYVEQRAEAWRAEQIRAKLRGAATPAEPSIIPAIEMLQNHRNALVVSGPGGGKSTLLQHLVGESAHWWLAPGQPEGGELPPFGAAVAIRCAATRLLTGKPWYQAVAEAVQTELQGHLAMPVSPEIFERPPRAGADWLVLVDGLDEIVQADRRFDLIETLAGHIATYGGQTRFVVSSRSLAETEFQSLRAQVARVDRSQRLGEYNLRPFDRAAVRSFAKRWYELRDPDFAQERAAGFLGEVERRRLMPLVSIPLLCTIAADVYQHNPEAQLPSGRTALYQKFVDGLLFGRRADTSARERIRQELAVIDRRAEEFGEAFFDRRADCLRFLAKLRMSQDRQPSVVSIRDWLSGEGLDPPSGITDDHLREVLLSTGLVVNRGDGMQFTHQSIAEFLSTRDNPEKFNWAVWLDSVTRNGMSSSDLFELGRWADAGHDPMPVVRALAEPGELRNYPLLPQLAEVVADGAAATATVARVALDAVQDIEARTPETLRAVSKAARALVQRAPDPSPLIQLINDGAAADNKRIEVASVLLSDGDDEGRSQAAAVLGDLAYAGDRPAAKRLPALHALADAGLPIQRRNALLHLRSLVHSAPVPQDRYEAAQMLVTLGEPGEVLTAFATRLTDLRTGADEWMITAGGVEALQDQIQKWIEHEGADPSPEPHRHGGQVSHWPWSIVRSAHATPAWVHASTAWALSDLAGSVAGLVPPDQVGSTITALMHDRTGLWSLRPLLVKRLSRPELAQFALEQLINDPSMAPEFRVTVCYTIYRELSRTGAAALLRGVAGNDRAEMSARFCAVNLLGLREDEGGQAWLDRAARDPEVAEGLRVEAAAVLTRCPGKARENGLDLLAELGQDPALSRRARRRARLGRRAALIYPATDRLTRGRYLTDRFDRYIWLALGRRLDRIKDYFRSLD